MHRMVLPRLLLVALLLGGLLLVPTVQAQLDTSSLYVEGFESLAVGNVPSNVAGQYTYQFVGTGSALAVSSPAIEGTRSLRVTPSTGNALATFNGAGGDYCNASGGIVFSVRLDALPTSGTNKFGITGYNGVGGDDFNPTTDGNTYVYLAIGTTGAASMVIENTPSVVSGETTDLIAGLTIAPDTDYTFHLTCPAEGTTGTFRLLEMGSVLDAQRSVTRAASGGSNAADDRFTAVSLATQTPVFIDQLSFYDDVGAVGASATAIVTGLTGFDVDYTGTVAIARTSSGENVETWAAQGLGTATGVVDTNCGVRSNGVTASPANVVFLDCSGDDTLVIAGNSLGVPEVPEGCSETDHFDSWNTDGIDESLVQEINDMGVFSVQWDVVADAEAGFDCRAVAVLPFSTNDGRVGTLAGVFSDGPLVKTVAYKQYASTSQAVLYVCGQMKFSTGNEAFTLDVVAADPSGSTVSYRFNGNVESPQIVQQRVMTGSLGLAGGLACSATTTNYQPILLNAGSAVRLVNLTSGSQLWARTDLVPVADGVDLSLDGKWAVAVTSATGYVLNATTGETVATLTLPSGTFNEVRIDSTGQNVWVATSTTIARFYVSDFTTGNPENTDLFCITNPLLCDPDGGGDGDGDGDGEGPDLGNSIFAGWIQGGTILTGSEVGGRIFATVILVLGFAAAGAAGLSPPAAGRFFDSKVWIFGLILGAIVGFAIAIGTEVFPKEWAFVMVLLGLVGLGVYWRLR